MRDEETFGSLWGVLAMFNDSCSIVQLFMFMFIFKFMCPCTIGPTLGKSLTDVQLASSPVLQLVILQLTWWGTIQEFFLFKCDIWMSTEPHEKPFKCNHCNYTCTAACTWRSTQGRDLSIAISIKWRNISKSTLLQIRLFLILKYTSQKYSNIW